MARKQSGNLAIFRVLAIAGLGLVIACVLVSLGFVLLEAGNYVLRK